MVSELLQRAYIFISLSKTMVGALFENEIILSVEM